MDAPKPPSASDAVSATPAVPRISRREKREARREGAQDYWAAKKLHKRGAKKEARRAEAEAKQAEWDALTEDEQQARREVAARERAEREAAQAASSAAIATLGPTPMCLIDLDFDDKMDEQEVRSLAQQIMYSYGANKRAPRPLRFHLSSLCGRIETSLSRINGFERWTVTKHAASYLDAFPREQIVYLSSESQDLLTSLDADTVYVIGGLVDHNRYKGLTHQQAEAAGVRTARLPIDEHMKMSQRRVLAVNHVFEILLHYTQHGDWGAALANALPQRRGATPKDEEASSHAYGAAAATAGGEPAVPAPAPAAGSPLRAALGAHLTQPVPPPAETAAAGSEEVNPCRGSEVPVPRVPRE